MPEVSLGNRSVIAMISDQDTGLKTMYRYPNIIQSTTNISIPPDRDLFSALRDVVATWQAHSDEAPAWVACAEDPEMEAILAKHFTCPAGRPDEWEHVMADDGLSSVMVPVAEGLDPPQLLDGGDVPS